MDAVLTKSDFIAAKACAKKLHYRKLKYPVSDEGSEFREMLAQGGHLLGKIAQLLHEGGVEVSAPLNQALDETEKMVQRSEVVLFEAAFLHQNMLVRSDVLVKHGMDVEIIEVKSKLHDSSQPFTEKPFDDILDDLAFQFWVIRNAHPEWSLTCCLLLPDKSAVNRIAGLPSWFHFRGEIAGPTDVSFGQRARKSVVFKFEATPDFDSKRVELVQNGLLAKVDVTALVLSRLDRVAGLAQKWIGLLHQGVESIESEIGWKCKACEYRRPDSPLDGFKQCWGNLAYVEHHMFELYRGGQLKGNDGNPVAELMFSNGMSSFRQLPEGIFEGTEGKVFAKRRQIQVENTLLGSEWIDPELGSFLSSLTYPVHFIDFETYAGAIPFHEGMRPGDWLGFQWSCHTLDEPGGRFKHQGWLHGGLDYPNFNFARTLMEHVGREGTFFCWSAHETTMLKAVLKQMQDRGHCDDELETWLKFATLKQNQGGPWVDMNQLAVKHYFHPDMKGSTSIKKVLPAVWNAHKWLHAHPDFADYAPDNPLEGYHDPYGKLGEFSDEEGDDEVVDGGTDAMRAYQQLQFGTDLDEAGKLALRRQLWEYCRLDTLAMTIVFTRWMKES